MLGLYWAYNGKGNGNDRDSMLRYILGLHWGYILSKVPTGSNHDCQKYVEPKTVPIYKYSVAKSSSTWAYLDLEDQNLNQP